MRVKAETETKYVVCRKYSMSDNIDILMIFDTRDEAGDYIGKLITGSRFRSSGYYVVKEVPRFIKYLEDNE